MTSQNELTIPPAASADPNSIEMARIWVAQRKLNCVLNIGHWHGTSGIDERHAWGIVLADIARHASNAIHEGFGTDVQENLNAIVESFRVEIGDKTSEHDGEWPEGRP